MCETIIFVANGRRVGRKGNENRQYCSETDADGLPFTCLWDRISLSETRGTHDDQSSVTGWYQAFVGVVEKKRTVLVEKKDKHETRSKNRLAISKYILRPPHQQRVETLYTWVVAFHRTRKVMQNGNVFNGEIIIFSVGLSINQIIFPFKLFIFSTIISLYVLLLEFHCVLLKHNWVI